MIPVSLQPVRLATDDGDGEGVLIFADGELLGVASRLSEAHEGLAGHWFVEAMFGGRDRWVGATFPDEEALASWAAGFAPGELAEPLRA